jgi:hypothetical protein
LQIIEPTEPVFSYNKEDKVNEVKGFLIGSKMTDRNWRLNKQMLMNKQKVDDEFLEHHFAIIPKLIFQHGKDGGGHYYGDHTLPSLLKGYADNSHGVIKETYGPFQWESSPGDIFYKFRARLHNDKAASVLVENGAMTTKPFSVSAHIWPNAGPDDDITDFTGIGVALVIKGAWGDDSVLEKMCSGPASLCKKSLAASSSKVEALTCRCDQCQETLAKMLTSFIDKAASFNNNMSTNLNPPSGPEGAAGTPGTPDVKPNNANIPQQDDNKVILSKEDHALLLQKIKENEEKAKTQEMKDKQLADLLKESRENAIARMFPSDLIKTDEAKNALLDSIKDEQDIKKFESFLNTVKKNYIPAVIEQEKAKWTLENKANANTKDEKEKGKDKAASSKDNPFELPKEPKGDSNQEEPKDKPASSSNRRNQIAEARALLTGGSFY